LQSFFTRWWREQTKATKDLVRKLVDNGQLDFVNGGYVQHDEAAAHYVAMIDQTTRGHRYQKHLYSTCTSSAMQLAMMHSPSHAQPFPCTIRKSPDRKAVLRSHMVIEVPAQLCVLIPLYATHACSHPKLTKPHTCSQASARLVACLCSMLMTT